MIGRLRDLARLRQKLGQVAAPAGRVVARAVSRHRRPGQHGLDAAAQPAGGFRLVAQIGCSTRSTSRVSIPPPAAPKNRHSVGVQRRAPLLPVLLVPELGQLMLEVALDRLPERQRVARLALLGQRIAPVPRELLVRRGLLARFGERHDGGLPGPVRAAYPGWSRAAPRSARRSDRRAGTVRARRRRDTCRAPARCEPAPRSEPSPPVASFRWHRPFPPYPSPNLSWNAAESSRRSRKLSADFPLKYSELSEAPGRARTRYGGLSLRQPPDTTRSLLVRVGRNFSLFSRVVAEGLYTPALAECPKSVLSGPIFSGPIDFGCFGGEPRGIDFIQHFLWRRDWIPTGTSGGKRP